MVAVRPSGSVPETGETVPEAVRRKLLDAILFGELAAPSRLFPTELALRFRVSVTPVREALARLASEGYIESIPRRGYHVRPPEPDSVRDLWSVRLALERLAGETVIARWPHRAERLAALEPMTAIYRRLAAEGARSHRQHVALNGQFHDTLVELSGNVLLASTYEGIRVRLFVAWIQRGSRAWRTRLGAEAEEHGAILQALEDGSAEAFTVAIRDHLSRSRRDALLDVQGTTKTNKEEESHDPTCLDGPRNVGLAPRGAATRRGADRNRQPEDVDLPQPGRHHPARGRAR